MAYALLKCIAKNPFIFMAQTQIEAITIPLSYFYIADTVNGIPNVSLNSDGIPYGFTALGATIGEGRFEYSRQLGLLELEGYSSALSGGTYYQNETASITIPLAELTYNNVLEIFQATSVSGNDIHFGGNTKPQERQVLLVTEHRAGTGIFHYFHLYKAVLDSSITMSFTKSSPSVFEVTFRGLLDITIIQGNQMGRVHIANV